MVLCVSANISGCATTFKLDEAIKRNASLPMEFKSSHEVGDEDQLKLKLFARGHRVDSREIDGLDYLVFQVEDVLEGKGRQLMLAVPDTLSPRPGHRAIVFEETASVGARRTSNVTASPPEFFRRQVWDESELNLVDKVCKDMSKDDVLFVLGESTSDALAKKVAPSGLASFDVIVVSPTSQTNLSEVAFARRGMPLTKRRDFLTMKVEDKLNWVGRSHAKENMLRSAYILSYPFDIVTFPFQLVLFISMF